MSASIPHGEIERGERNVALLKVCRVAEAMNCKPSELLDDADF